jgi:NAD-dependent dihydropyrimidine dehydrogenase PreA subunit
MPCGLFAQDPGDAGGSKAAITDRDKCMEYGACALNCPVKAIREDAGIGCVSGMINQ